MYDVIAAGRSVLIHCMAGRHRAPMCAAGALSVLLDVGFREAYGYILDSGRDVDPRSFMRFAKANYSCSMQDETALRIRD